MAAILQNYAECLRKTGDRTEARRADERVKAVLAKSDLNTVDVGQLRRER
jgi:hypothetical protein